LPAVATLPMGQWGMTSTDTSMASATGPLRSRASYGRAGARLSSAARAPVHPAVPSRLRRHRARARNQAAGCRLRLRSGRDPGRRARRHHHRAGRRRGARRPGPPAPPQGGFQVGELEALPFPARSFTAVTSSNAVQYAANPTATQAPEVRRVATPGAWVAISTFGQPRDCEMRTVFAALRPLLPPLPPGRRRPVRAVGAGPAGGAGSTGRAHPDPRGRGGLPVRLSRRPDGLAGAVLSGAVPGRHPRRRRAAGAAGGRGRAGPYRTSGGGVRLEHSFRYLLARA
jgi:hypothetical protein